MYVCMCVYMYVCMYICMYVCIDMNVRSCSNAMSHTVDTFPLDAAHIALNST